MFRAGFQYVSGDKVYKGDKENLTPPPAADIDWNRQVYSVELYHQFIPHLGAGIGIPIYVQDIHNNATDQDTFAKGIGDLFFYALFTPWAETDAEEGTNALSLRNVSIMAGLSVPTGNELQGEVPALHNFHLGSGSVEFKFSARYDAPISASVSLFGAASMTVDGGANSLGFRYGDGFDFQWGGVYAPIEGVRLVASFDAVVRQKDLQGGMKLPDSGGTWWFATIGALLSPLPRVWIEPSVAIPIYWRVNGNQPVSREIWSLGIRYQF